MKPDLNLPCSMSHWLRAALVSQAAIIAACLFSLSGCGEPSSAPAQRSELDERIEAAFAELPAGDRDKARAQAACPVTGEALGSMGAPYKVTVDGRDVFLCCEGCEGELTGHPEKYLAKLKTAAR